MADTKRRSVIKLAGSAAAVASTGMAGILATGRAPAYAQTKTVHWLRWVDFVPASDQLMSKVLMPEAEQAAYGVFDNNIVPPTFRPKVLEG